MKSQVKCSAALGAAFAVLALGSAADAVGQQAAMFRSSADHSGFYADPGPESGAALSWRFATNGPVRSSPTVLGNVVYVGSGDGFVYALDRATGNLLWSRELIGPVNSTPAVADGAVYVGSRDGTFYSLDGRTGSVIWSFSTGDPLSWEWGLEGWDVYTSSPTIAGDAVLFGAPDGVVYAVDSDDGTLIWRYATDGIIRSSPAVVGNEVFVGSADGTVYALSLDTGAELWTFVTEGASLTSAAFGFDRKSIISSPAVSGSAVYVGSRDGHMYALNRATGEQLWRTDHQVSWAMSSPAIAGDLIFSGSSDGVFVHAVAAASGEELWRYTGTGYMWSSPSVAGNTVYIGDRGGFLRAVDRLTGEERWSYPVPGGVLSSPTIADNAVYFGGEDGGVYALAESSRPAPRRAVFWDDEMAQFAAMQGGTSVREYLVEESYEVLNADGLREFMEDGVTGDRPSVVVFALDYVPASVASVASDTVLFRRYLEGGGKVVWLGLPPALVQRDSNGAVVAVDKGRPGSLTGVDWSSLNYDFYGAFPTEVGGAWGLAGWWMSWCAIDAVDGIEVLAREETGKAAGWVRNYGGPPGSGFVNLGSERWLVRNLGLILAAAEYGLSD